MMHSIKRQEKHTNHEHNDHLNVDCCKRMTMTEYDDQHDVIELSSLKCVFPVYWSMIIISYNIHINTGADTEYEKSQLNAELTKR